MEDKKVLLGQKGLEDVFNLARAAELYVVGIGEIGAARAHARDRHDHRRRSCAR